MFDKRRNFKKRFPRCPNGLSPSQRQRGNLTRVSGEASADKPRGNLLPPIVIARLRRSRGNLLYLLPYYKNCGRQIFAARS